MIQHASVRAKALALLERIDRLDPLLNAYVAIDRDAVLRDADRLDAVAPQDRGPLHGITLGIKDLIDVAGLPTRAGSSFFERRPSRDAAVVRRLREAGALIVGKTGTHEFAWGITSENPHTGRIANPWDTARTPGGSSGGSGAAVAAELCDLALGTDTMGSVRIPSACCNTSGIRPASGTIAMDGIFPLAPSLDIAGPIGPDVAGVRDALAVMRGAAFGAVPFDGRVARLRGGRWDDLSPALAAAFDEAASALRDAGITVDEVAWWDDELAEAASTVQRYQAARVHAELFPAHRDEYGADVRALLERALSVTDEQRAAASATIARAREEFLRVTAPYAVLLAPSVPDEAPRSPVSPAFRTAVIPLVAPPSAFGLPALAVPIGVGPNGCPLGMQMIATASEPDTVLALGVTYQTLTSWHRRRPVL
ncbi:MAG TPA: amidase [Candidatus Acidoferrum sp.]|jgi:aspartyl-tRNA(Asn)/glutamyl-tRNA(Gln) amidotransferase subunit A|nr:amidase [Candidatus Acidoferrum sp.]